MLLPPDPWTMAVRVRRLLARPGARRLLVGVVALGTGLTVASLARSMEHARERWGDTRPVAVARRDLRPGDLVDADAAVIRELPDAAVADHALAEAPVGSVVREAVVAGEPFVQDRLAPEGLRGVAALVPEGHRGVSLPLGPAGVPPLQIGDQVDLLAVLPTAGDLHGHEAAETSASRTAPAFPLVERAVVVNVAEQSVTVAVPAADAPSVAFTVTHGVVLLALAGA